MRREGLELPTKNITSVVDQVTLVLEDAILAGDLAPGTVLRQGQLAEELGVSRTPIREALRQLAARDLVSIEKNRGYRVNRPTKEELHDAWLIRAEVEALAAELAVERMSQAQLNRLGQAAKQFRELTTQLKHGDGHDAQTFAGEWLRANAEFHDVILEAAASSLLTRIATGLRRIFVGQPLWPSTAEIDALFQSNIVQHEQIHAAFAARDPQVRELVRNHVLESARMSELLVEEVDKQRKRLLPRARAVR